MNRGYTIKHFLELVNYIRRKIPDAKISTDVIVGFPGETEAEYLDTEKLIKTGNFFRVNTAAFSPGPGTPAASLSDQLDEKTKKSRLTSIMEIVDKYTVKG